MRLGYVLEVIRGVVEHLELARANKLKHLAGVFFQSFTLAKVAKEDGAGQSNVLGAEGRSNIERLNVARLACPC